ncbi:MAG: YggS family pyridoxal phosphate-dependent enzyme [Alphaproteobacteria bacterium]|nr:YggS family pyridoxal phosphate-dependent enzyme [Alphaproteobacteria bacterium]
MSPSVVQESLQAVWRRIADSRKDALSPSATTALIAVTKSQPSERIEWAIAAGQREFGENRVQEATKKWPGLREQDPGLRLHLIGPLQTNKVREAVALFDVIHSLDRPRLCQALAEEFQRSGKRLDLLVQVNTGEEPQKAGVLPNDFDDLIALAAELKLRVAGLMCIPPAGASPAPHFALLREMAKRSDLPWLSMGMSRDFETAIRFGATHVRVGSAIFGARS